MGIEAFKKMEEELEDEDVGGCEMREMEEVGIQGRWGCGRTIKEERKCSHAYVP